MQVVRNWFPVWSWNVWECYVSWIRSEFNINKSGIKYKFNFSCANFIYFRHTCKSIDHQYLNLRLTFFTNSSILVVCHALVNVFALLLFLSGTFFSCLYSAPSQRFLGLNTVSCLHKNKNAWVSIGWTHCWASLHGMTQNGLYWSFSLYQTWPASFWIQVHLCMSSLNCFWNPKSKFVVFNQQQSVFFFHFS